MKRIKSTLEDEIMLLDENASPPDRVNSMKKLASDGFGDKIHPVLDNWLNHSHFLLRDAAVSMLLVSWGQQKYVGKVIEMLHNDTDWSVRGTAATALANFSKEFIEGSKYEQKIVGELLISLLKDEDEFVQRDSYKGLYKLIKGECERSDENEFARNRDVDWDLLQPYLDKYGLQKPI